MLYPARLAHLVTRPILASKLTLIYAEAHQLDDEEALELLTRAFGGALWEEVLASLWQTLQDANPKMEEERLLEKVARTLRDRPMRAGPVIESNPAWSAFLLRVDLAAGTASDAARRVMETEAGQTMARKGLAEASVYLARELSKGK